MKFYINTKDYSVSKENFELRYEEDFDMLITFPQPENLHKYYESTVYISHTDSKDTLTDKLYHFIKKYNLKYKLKIVEKHSIAKKSLLDVGAGTGDFLHLAETNGWQINGIEPNESAREKALKKGILLQPSLEVLNNEKFDVITLWHVLEHLPNLNDQISRLSKLLDKDGIIVVAVPNFKSFDALHYKNFWAAFDVPRHLWHFSRTAISKLFLKEKMLVAKSYPMIFDAFYVSLLSEKYKHGKQRFIIAFLIGLFSNMKAWHSKEYSSIIYVIKKGQN